MTKRRSRLSPQTAGNIIFWHGNIEFLNQKYDFNIVPGAREVSKKKKEESKKKEEDREEADHSGEGVDESDSDDENSNPPVYRVL